jgi:outer membrane protein
MRFDQPTRLLQPDRHLKYSLALKYLPGLRHYSLAFSIFDGGTMSNLKNFLLWPGLALMAVFLVFSIGSGAAQAQNIGVVDLKKAVDESKAGKAANNKLQAKYESLKKSLDNRQKELEKKEKDLRSQASTLNQDALEKRGNDLANDVRTFREQAQKATDEMQKAMTDAMSPLFTKAEQAAARLASERGFSMVMDVKEGGVVFFQSAIDITADITKALDR